MQKPPYTTKQTSQVSNTKEGTIRSSYCRDGHFLGVVPLKLSTGQLRWPADLIDAIFFPKGSNKQRVERSADEKPTPAAISPFNSSDCQACALDTIANSAKHGE